MATKTTENTTTGTADKKMTVENATVKESEMKNAPLHKFFVDALKDIYYAEHKLVDALQTMHDAATTEELKDAFEDHQLQTKKHISRLEKVFKLINESPEQKNVKQWMD
ncbi:DUF892 family protein [Chryseobacterium tructae]|nr:DUF892 family protein [Chryseobacterium tructae]MDN3694292.1 DUF892 family protein [Chryseobacterium tructae]